MDPNACLRRILESHVDGDVDDVWHAIDDLHTWLDKGGFSPNWDAQPEATQIYCERLAELTYA